MATKLLWRLIMLCVVTIASLSHSENMSSQFTLGVEGEVRGGGEWLGEKAPKNNHVMTDTLANLYSIISIQSLSNSAFSNYII